MFAVIAAIIWFLAAFGLGLGKVDMLLLGLGFVALHLAFGSGLAWPSVRRRT
jgi:hypothetical protein